MAIEKGDIVVVRAGPLWQRGAVTSANNYGTEDDPDWYIEFTAEDGKGHYVKQHLDGVEVTKMRPCASCSQDVPVTDGWGDAPVWCAACYSGLQSSQPSDVSRWS